ncbi:unnamed protein product [Somion occarium]|uniref:Uncharacterized protein n=1 Tax=Somion occarium TaxID=3059160 RepID=A0ABP1DCB2_9APHY
MIVTEVDMPLVHSPRTRGLRMPSGVHQIIQSQSFNVLGGIARRLDLRYMQFPSVQWATLLMPSLRCMSYTFLVVPRIVGCPDGHSSPIARLVDIVCMTLKLTLSTTDIAWTSVKWSVASTRPFWPDVSLDGIAPEARQVLSHVLTAGRLSQDYLVFLSLRVAICGNVSTSSLRPRRSCVFRGHWASTVFIQATSWRSETNCISTISGLKCNHLRSVYSTRSTLEMLLLIEADTCCRLTTHF